MTVQFCFSLQRGSLFVVALFACMLSAARTHELHAQGRMPAIVDTMMQPGHLDYSRYDAPSQCVQAAISMVRVAERAKLDTLPYAPERDTLSDRVIKESRKCGARFTVASVAPRELLSLVQLSLILKDEKQASAAANRLFALTPDSAKRGWAMYSVVKAYLQSRPMRLAQTDRMVARLDSLGQRAILPRLLAHALLLQDAKKRFDTAWLEREALITLALDPFLTDTERQNENTGIGAGSAALELLWAKLYRSPQTAVVQVLNEVQKTGYKWPSSEAQVKTWLDTFAGLIGQPVTPVNAQHWFGPHGNNNWPVPGKVTLFLFSSPNERSNNFDQYAMLQRLHRKFGDDINITVMVKTAGYIGNSAPLTVKQEVDSIRAYYQDEHKLAVTVGVIETPFQRLPDGRRLPSGVPSDEFMMYAFGPVIADRNGNLVGFGLSEEAAFEAYINQALGRPAVAKSRDTAILPE